MILKKIFKNFSSCAEILKIFPCTKQITQTFNSKFSSQIYNFFEKTYNQNIETGILYAYSQIIESLVEKDTNYLYSVMIDYLYQIFLDSFEIIDKEKYTIESQTVQIAQNIKLVYLKIILGNQARKKGSKKMLNFFQQMTKRNNDFVVPVEVYSGNGNLLPSLNPIFQILCEITFPKKLIITKDGNKTNINSPTKQYLCFQSYDKSKKMFSNPLQWIFDLKDPDKIMRTIISEDFQWKVSDWNFVVKQKLKL